MDDDRNEWGFTRRLMGRIPDVMSRALVAGTGALFLTEEGIRNLVSELKLPGDMVRGLVQQAEVTKRELFRFVGQEIRTFLEQANLSQELVKVLAGVTMDVHTTIRFVPNESGGVTPKVQTEQVSFGEERGGGEPAPAAAGEGSGAPRPAAEEPARSGPADPPGGFSGPSEDDEPD